MTPESVYQDGKKGWMISHKCGKCKKIMVNKAAPDDNFDEIIRLSGETGATRKGIKFL
jgi:hypothetical protein